MRYYRRYNESVMKNELNELLEVIDNEDNINVLEKFLIRNNIYEIFIAGNEDFNEFVDVEYHNKSLSKFLKYFEGIDVDDGSIIVHDIERDKICNFGYNYKNAVKEFCKRMVQGYYEDGILDTSMFK